MSAMEPLCLLLGVNPKKLSKYKIRFLEAELFVRIYAKLEEIFRNRYKNFFRLMNFTLHMETTMLEANFVRFLIENMISTGNYTMQGIVSYTDTPEDTIHEIMIGRNTSPSVTFVRKLIELDRVARKDFYQAIVKESLDEKPAKLESQEIDTTD